MKLKIVSTNWILFEWDVEEVVVPTMEGEAGILPGHALYTAVIKWWICKIKTNKEEENLINQGEYKLISVWDGVVYTDGNVVSLAVSSANSRIDLSEEELEEMRKKLEKELEEIKAKWSLEEIEKALFKMNKLLADIELKEVTKKMY